MKKNDCHYLKEELYSLVSQEPGIFEFLQSGSLDGLWYWDLEAPENEWMNSRFWELLGYDPNTKEHLAQEWQDLINPDDLQRALHNFYAHCGDPTHPYDQIVRYRHANGSTVWVRCRGVAIRDQSGKPIRMLGAHNDITELKQAELLLKQQAEELQKMQEKLKALALRDGLTGLYNRRALQDHLEWSIKNSHRRVEHLSVALIDLDHFKQINDSSGHQMGDKVLQATAKTLNANVRQNDFVARYGGEEFIVLFPNTNIEESIIAAERLRSSLAEIDLNPINITTSIGISTYLSGHESITDPTEISTDLIASADRALYAAKHLGRNRTIHVKHISL